MRYTGIFECQQKKRQMIEHLEENEGAKPQLQMSGR